MSVLGEASVGQKGKDLKSNHFDSNYCFSLNNTFGVYGLGLYDQVTAYEFLSFVFLIDISFFRYLNEEII